MRIKYIGGSAVRTIGPYRWDESNGFVQEVKDHELIENLQTYPYDDWQFLDDDDDPAAGERPLTDINGIGPVRATELADRGVETVGQLAALDADEFEDLLTRIGANRQELEDWYQQAQALEAKS